MRKEVGKLSKRAQITPFIIVGVILVVAVLLYFLLRGGVSPNVNLASPTNPVAFLDGCIEDKVVEAVEILGKQGGYIEPANYRDFKFEDEETSEKVSYLCYSANNYEQCVNQEPMLIQHLKDEIHGYIEEEVQNCIDSLAQGLEDEGFDADISYGGFEVILMPRKVNVDINAEVKMTRSGETSTKSDFMTSAPSRFYDLAIVAQEITSQEAKYCNFEQINFMLFYKQFDIDKFKTGDSTIIYTVKERETDDMFRFAVRSCVIPPGG